MWPTLFEVQGAAGPVGVHTYGLFLVLAFSAAFLVVHVRARRVGIDPDRLIGAYVCAAVFGMAGGRLLFALAVEPARTFSSPMSLLSCSGFAVQGGVIGGALGVGAFAAAMGINGWKLADLAGPSVLVGMGVGRIGCFFAGCCHGAPAPIGPNPIGLLPEAFPGQVWLSGTFPFVTTEFEQGVGRILNVPLYPTQLWSIFLLLSLAGFLGWLWTRRSFDGQIAALTLILEPPFRILFEGYRADERGYVVSWPVSERMAALLPPGVTHAGSGVTDTAVAGITTAQGISVALVIVGVAIYLRRRNTGRAPEVVAAPIDALHDELV